MRRAALLALLLGAGPGAAGPADDGAAEALEEERAALEERLAAERAALDALGAEKESLLSLLDTLERLARDSGLRRAALQASLVRVTAAQAQAQAQAEASRAAQARRAAVLRPRLLALYRAQRQGALATLLTARDFEALVRQQRALATLVGEDARVLEELAVLAEDEGLKARRLQRLSASAARLLSAVSAEEAVGAQRRERFGDLLKLVTAQQARASRVVAELEVAQTGLSRLVTELGETAATGFRARKGTLPFPTDGRVEVGFGKVVNPRFNTVTVQKGLDVRAPAGTRVAAVAPGVVAFAGWLKGYGYLVIVDHGEGFHTLYAHLQELAQEPGSEVDEGSLLGSVGDTGSLKGPYLYFELRRQGLAVDPLPWLKPR